MKLKCLLIGLLFSSSAFAGWKDGLIAFGPYVDQYAEKCAAQYERQGRPNMLKACKNLVGDTPGNYKSLKGKADYKACKKAHKKDAVKIQECFAAKQNNFYSGFLKVMFND